MLSALSPGQRAELLSERPEAAAIEVGIDLSRALGYALFNDRDGGASVAAAVLNSEGYPVAAISCPFEAIDARAERLHEGGRALVEAARRASGNVGMAQGISYIRPSAAGRVDARVGALATGRDFMGENPIWSQRHGKLFWLDILAPALRSYDPKSRRAERIELPEIVGGLALRHDGGFVMLGRHGIFEFDIGRNALKLLISPEADRPDNRFNTAAVDSAGNLWAGTMAISHEPGRGSLYRITPHLNVTRALEKVGLPKNVAWSLDGTRLYLSDGGDGVLYDYPFSAADGTLGAPRKLLEGNADIGVPNGITVDSEGCIWVAMLGGWEVRRIAPDGTLVDRVILPVPMPTNLCFGGEGLATLFVTSTYLRLPPGYSTLAPQSGSVFAIECTVPGLTAPAFGGMERS
jgi:sugar lactone lactonase YvrE